MMAWFPAARMCQYADDEGLRVIAEVFYPGHVTRLHGVDNLALWAEGMPTDPEARGEAARKFQLLLGVLRTWWDDAGELWEERLGDLGDGSVRDESGAQWVGGIGVVDYSSLNVLQFAYRAQLAVQMSQKLADALTVFGRSKRDSADYYLVYEFAQREFCIGTWARLKERQKQEALERALPSITAADQSLFWRSANNRSPFEGGRHAGEDHSAPWTLDEQRLFISQLLGAWIEKRVAESQG